MKALKTVIVVVIVMYLCVLTACGDHSTPTNFSSDKNPTSSEKEIQSLSQFTSTNPDTALMRHSFDASFKFNPGQTLILNYYNTALIQISSYSISNCVSGRNDIHIQSLNFPGGNNLPCEWDCGPGLLLENLSIKNMSGFSKIISIKMDGWTLNH